MNSCWDLLIIPAVPVELSIGHSTAVRICCSHLCLVFISPIAVLCILEFTTLSLLIRGEYGRAHLRHTDVCRRRYCLHRSDGIPHPRRVRHLTHRSCGQLTLIASFWEPGVRSRSAFENRCAPFDEDEGTPTNGTPFRYPHTLREVSHVGRRVLVLIMLPYASAFPCVHHRLGQVYDTI